MVDEECSQLVVGTYTVVDLSVGVEMGSLVGVGALME